MPLLKEAIYNDLNGLEAKEILVKRFYDRLNEIPWLARHISLPRVRMRLTVQFETYTESDSPDSQTLTDDFTVRTENAIGEVPPPPRPGKQIERFQEQVEDIIDTSPHTGQPPDQIREEHNLTVPTPKRHPLTRQLSDQLYAGEEVEMTPGISVKRDVSGGGIPSPSRGATTVTQDYGPRVSGGQGTQVPIKNRDRSENPAPPASGFKDAHRGAADDRLNKRR